MNFGLSKKGRWIGGEYRFRPPLPLTIETRDDEIMELVRSHNEVTKLFWISAVVVIPSVLIALNLIN